MKLKDLIRKCYTNIRVAVRSLNDSTVSVETTGNELSLNLEFQKLREREVEWFIIDSNRVVIFVQ